MSPADERLPEIDPAIVAAQRALAPRLHPIDPSRHSPAEMRDRSERSAAVWADGLPAVAAVRDLALPGPGGAIRARWLDSRRDGARAGAILFLHGGGWMIGSVDTHDRVMRSLAAETGCPVLGIDYRLSPEHAFPAALDDARAALAWLRGEAGALGVDAGRIAVAGDSAGANLGLAAALAERDAGGAAPAALALFYACLAPDFDTASHAANGDGRFGLTTERMRYYWSHYLGGPEVEPAPLAAPLRADLRGLPPVFVGYAECDPLADDSVRLAAALAQAGVRHRLACWPGAVHGFLQMSRDVPLAQTALAEAAAWLRAAIGPDAAAAGPAAQDVADAG